MLFNWKMKPNNKMTVTMFSPDNFKMSTKPQKVVTTTGAPKAVITQESPPKPTISNTWEFYNEAESKKPKNQVPPLEKMISAPGNLQQFITQAKNEQNIKQFHVNPPQSNTTTTTTGVKFPKSRRHRTRIIKPSGDLPTFQSQNSTPAMLSLVPPINRNRQRKTKPPRPYLNSTKKLASASDLSEMIRLQSTSKEEINKPREIIQQQQTQPPTKTFQPPPLMSRYSESSLPVFRNGPSILPSLKEMVSGSPIESPGTSPYSSDQEMRDVERQTGKMSINNLLG